MFYEDLSEYNHVEDDSFTDLESNFYGLWYRPAYARLNIGWLEAGKPYSTGTVPAAFVEKLETVQRVQWMNVCLGVHKCDLCPWKEVSEGNGEIRIPGGPGIAHAAPFLITHYVTAHGYRPPQVFIDAVLAVDVVTWAALHGGGAGDWGAPLGLAAARPSTRRSARSHGVTGERAERVKKDGGVELRVRCPAGRSRRSARTQNHDLGAR